MFSSSGAIYPFIHGLCKFPVKLLKTSLLKGIHKWLYFIIQSCVLVSSSYLHNDQLKGLHHSWLHRAAVLAAIVTYYYHSFVLSKLFYILSFLLLNVNLAVMALLSILHMRQAVLVTSPYHAL